MADQDPKVAGEDLTAVAYSGPATHVTRCLYTMQDGVVRLTFADQHSAGQPTHFQNGKRECVVVMRERNGRARSFVSSEHNAVPLVRNTVAEGSTVYADEATSWDVLGQDYTTKRINHSECYSDGQACTNGAESYFSRLRRAEIGTHHSVAGPYLSAYAEEMAWRENQRRNSNGSQYMALASAAAHHPISRKWKGYWQRRAV